MKNFSLHFFKLRTFFLIIFIIGFSLIGYKSFIILDQLQIRDSKLFLELLFLSEVKKDNSGILISMPDGKFLLISEANKNKLQISKIGNLSLKIEQKWGYSACSYGVDILNPMVHDRYFPSNNSVGDILQNYDHVLDIIKKWPSQPKDRKLEHLILEVCPEDNSLYSKSGFLAISKGTLVQGVTTPERWGDKFSDWQISLMKENVFSASYLGRRHLHDTEQFDLQECDPILSKERLELIGMLRKERWTENSTSYYFWDDSVNLSPEKVMIFVQNNYEYLDQTFLSLARVSQDTSEFGKITLKPVLSKEKGNYCKLTYEFIDWEPILKDNY